MTVFSVQQTESAAHETRKPIIRASRCSYDHCIMYIAGVEPQSIATDGQTPIKLSTHFTKFCYLVTISKESVLSLHSTTF